MAAEKVLRTVTHQLGKEDGGRAKAFENNVIDDLPRQLGSNQKQRTFFAAGTERWRINLVTDNSELVSNAIADWCSAVSSLIVQKIKNLARTAPPIYRQGIQYLRATLCDKLQRMGVLNQQEGNQNLPMEEPARAPRLYNSAIQTPTWGTPGTSTPHSDTPTFHDNERNHTVTRTPDETTIRTIVRYGYIGSRIHRFAVLAMSSHWQTLSDISHLTDFRRSSLNSLPRASLRRGFQLSTVHMPSSNNLIHSTKMLKRPAVHLNCVIFLDALCAVRIVPSGGLVLSRNAAVAGDKEDVTTRISFSTLKVTRVENISGAIRKCLIIYQADRALATWPAQGKATRDVGPGVKWDLEYGSDHHG
ncbi:hypothetical protein BGY98DRAFT_1126467 [Russula aff. rugulosa BPL654]|nr:hypothetical protein BGY98DRAFT_1126467 [Russula aff. rugulosa BPL654]